ncbi:hypothetical protein M413DRAFT_13283 [Hebeloma cylindrosporum]|uniref:F-box domain-containing protein n=1 Tax=Hebeloma cylindrosporum TaxID=76867 RepID=A0A0C3BLN3_HEBCY|nr:hypothetical protein M413DRAFT_13283 [Hebeloma cylindrosporum h7]
MDLPLELMEEISFHAVFPSSQNQFDPASYKRSYATAKSIALVSFLFRELVMRYFLHTVILSSQRSAEDFLGTLAHQKSLTKKGFRLATDYTRFVRRFWCTAFRQLPGYKQAPIDLSPLYPFIAGAQNLGITQESSDFLYEILHRAPLVRLGPVLPNWTCTRLTIGGAMRWNALFHSVLGKTFLRRLTHLTFWETPKWGQMLAVDSIRAIPFEEMPNLTHFAFVIYADVQRYSPCTICVYSRELEENCDEVGSVVFRRWAENSEAGKYGYTSVAFDGLQIPSPESAFFLEYNDIWE